VHLSNEASYLRQQDIFTPGVLIDAVSPTAKFVNRLFPVPLAQKRRRQGQRLKM
jgi:hypothetical protein